MSGTGRRLTILHNGVGASRAVGVSSVRRSTRRPGWRRRKSAAPSVGVLWLPGHSPRHRCSTPRECARPWPARLFSARAPHTLATRRWRCDDPRRHHPSHTRTSIRHRAARRGRNRTRTTPLMPSASPRPFASQGHHTACNWARLCPSSRAGIRAASASPQGSRARWSYVSPSTLARWSWAPRRTAARVVAHHRGSSTGSRRRRRRPYAPDGSARLVARAGPMHSCQASSSTVAGIRDRGRSGTRSRSRRPSRPTSG